MAAGRESEEQSGGGRSCPLPCLCCANLLPVSSIQFPLTGCWLLPISPPPVFSLPRRSPPPLFLLSSSSLDSPSPPSTSPTRRFRIPRARALATRNSTQSKECPPLACFASPVPGPAAFARLRFHLCPFARSLVCSYPPCFARSFDWS